MARTEYTFALNSEGRGVGGAASINLAITDDATTTAVIKMAGCPFGRIHNESGGTITLFEGRTSAAAVTSPVNSTIVNNVFSIRLCGSTSLHTPHP